MFLLQAVEDLEEGCWIITVAYGFAIPQTAIIFMSEGKGQTQRVTERERNECGLSEI